MPRLALWIDRPSLAIQARVYEARRRALGTLPPDCEWVVRPGSEVAVDGLLAGGFIDDELIAYLWRYRRSHGAFPPIVLLYDGLANRLATGRLFKRQVHEKRGLRKLSFAGWFAVRTALEGLMRRRSMAERFDAYADPLAAAVLGQEAAKAGHRFDGYDFAWVGQPLSEDRLLALDDEVAAILQARAKADARSPAYVAHPRDSEEKLRRLQEQGVATLRLDSPVEVALFGFAGTVGTFFSSGGFNLALVGRPVHFFSTPALLEAFGPEYRLVRQTLPPDKRRLVELPRPGNLFMAGP